MVKRLWVGKNEIIHEDGYQKKLRREIKFVRQQITDEFATNGNNARCSDRYLYEQRALPELLALNISSQKHWLENVSAAEARYANQHQYSLDQMESNLRSWLLGPKPHD